MYFFTFKTTALEQQFYHIDDDLLVKYLLGEATASEQTAVEAWQQADAANLQHYLQLQEVWEANKTLESTTAVDENAAWQRFQQRVKAAQPGSGKRFGWWRVAAAAVLLAGLITAGWLVQNREKPVREYTLQTNSRVSADSLPDGSVITLNRNTRISRKEKFNGPERRVRLETGEAFFKVAPDKEHPFVIDMQEVQVTVVGTSFNIRREKNTTIVVVETGVVKVTSGGQTAELRAGEQLTVQNGQPPAAKKPVQDKLYNYYRTREFVCDNTPLWRLVEVLNEAYDAQITIGRKALNDLRLDATFTNESLAQVLEVIRLTFDVQVIQKDGQIILQ